MANQNNFATTVSEDISVGTVSWTDIDEVKVADVLPATIAYLGDDLNPTEFSHLIHTSAFGFTIPTGATIDGIEVEVDRWATGSLQKHSVRDQFVRLYKGGVLAPTNRGSLLVTWPTISTVKTYGSSSDLWGNTWTAEDINDPTFGVGFSVRLDDQNGYLIEGFIDYLKVTVYYTPAVEPPPSSGLDYWENGTPYNCKPSPDCPNNGQTKFFVGGVPYDLIGEGVPPIPPTPTSETNWFLMFE